MSLILFAIYLGVNASNGAIDARAAVSIFGLGALSALAVATVVALRLLRRTRHELSAISAAFRDSVRDLGSHAQARADDVDASDE